MKVGKLVLFFAVGFAASEASADSFMARCAIPQHKRKSRVIGAGKKFTSFTKTKLHNVDFSKAQFISEWGTVFQKAVLTCVDFSEANFMPNTDGGNTSFKNTKFKHVKFTGADFDGGVLFGDSLYDVDFSGAFFKKGSIHWAEGTSFYGRLEQVKFDNAVFEPVIAEFGGTVPTSFEAHFKHVTFRNTKFKSGVDFTKNNGSLYNVDFTGAVLEGQSRFLVPLHTVNFSHARIVGEKAPSGYPNNNNYSYFWGTTLTDVKFDNAQLKRVIFGSVSFGEGVSFKGATLSDIEFFNSHFAKGTSFANVTFGKGVSFKGAVLCGVDFSGAKGMKQVDFTGAKRDGSDYCKKLAKRAA